VNGNRQKQGVDFAQSRADTLSLPLLRFFLSVMLMLGMTLMQYDVPSAFLQSPIDVTAYLRQPIGFIEPGKENWVWKLKKCVYGLRQASLQWRNEFHSFITSKLNFTEIGYNSSSYLLKKDDIIKAILIVYVDDFILATKDKSLHSLIETKLIQRFRVKKLGTPKNFLGMQFDIQNSHLFIHQEEYIDDMMKKLQLTHVTPCSNPQPDGLLQYNDADEPFDTQKYQSAIGKLIWLSVCTRPDIAFYVSFYASLMAKPTIGAWKHLVQLISYVNCTKKYGILLNSKPHDLQLLMHVDSGHANELLWRRSVSGYILYFLGGPIHWGSHKIHSVVKSSMESEYIAISDASLEAKYFLQIVNQVLPSIQHVNLYTDNEAARKVVEGNGQIRKIKHLHTGYHLAQQMVIEGLIHIDWIPSSANTADILTKHIGSMKLFSKHRSEMVHESGNSW
jgi:hypothetical protein